MANKPDQSSWALDTLLVHGDKQRQCANHTGMPTVLPIYTSTTYLHQNAEMLEQAFSEHSPSEEQVYIYAQQGNPNAHALESVLAQVEGGVGAVTFGSGMAAIHTAFLAAGLAPGLASLFYFEAWAGTWLFLYLCRRKYNEFRRGAIGPLSIAFQRKAPNRHLVAISH